MLIGISLYGIKIGCAESNHNVMKKICTILIVSFIALAGHAQWNERNPSLAIGLQVAEPRGQFDQNYDGYPTGIAANFTAPVRRSPFELGVGFAWNSMGNSREDVSVFIGQDKTGDDVYEQGEMRITSNNYRYHMVGRFKPFKGPFQIYGDVMAGVERFTTSTDIELTGSGYTEVIEENTAHRDFGWSIGWALGTRIRVARSFFIDARFENLNGGTATFVDQESILINPDDNTLDFQTKETRTNKFTYQLGIALEF